MRESLSASIAVATSTRRRPVIRPAMRSAVPEAWKPSYTGTLTISTSSSSAIIDWYSHSAWKRPWSS